MVAGVWLAGGGARGRKREGGGERERERERGRESMVPVVLYWDCFLKVNCRVGPSNVLKIIVY